MPEAARSLSDADLVPATEGWQSSVLPKAAAHGTSARLVRIDDFRRRYVPEETSAPWQPVVLDRIERLLKLRQGWDSYAAVPIAHDAGMFALVVLNNVMGPRTPTPTIVPTSTGGLQLEWHEKGIDLEVRVLGPYRCDFVVEDSRGEIESSEDALSDDFSVLVGPLEALTARA
jgi:hypothetical protein